MAAFALLLSPAFASAATPYESLVLADGAKAYYRLADSPNSLGNAVGVRATDRTGNNHGTFSSGTLQVDGAVTDGNRATDRPRMTANFTNVAERTIEFWIKNSDNGTAQDPHTQIYMTHGLSGGPNAGGGWQLFSYLSGADLKLAILIGGYVVDLPCAVPTGSDYQNYMISWNPSTRVVKCFVNGAEQLPAATVQHPLNSDPPAATPQFTVTADATLDEISLYPGIADEAAAKRHYDRALQPFNTSIPRLSGVLVETADLDSTTGSWRGANLTLSYTWGRCTTATLSSCVAISGAAAEYHTQSTDDIGKYMVVRVDASNQHGSVYALSKITTQQVAPHSLIDEFAAQPWLEPDEGWNFTQPPNAPSSDVEGYYLTNRSSANDQDPFGYYGDPDDPADCLPTENCRAPSSFLNNPDASWATKVYNCKVTVYDPWRSGNKVEGYNKQVCKGTLGKQELWTWLERRVNGDPVSEDFKYDTKNGAGTIDNHVSATCRDGYYYRVFYQATAKGPSGGRIYQIGNGPWKKIRC